MSRSWCQPGALRRRPTPSCNRARRRAAISLAPTPKQAQTVAPRSTAPFPGRPAIADVRLPGAQVREPELGDGPVARHGHRLGREKDSPCQLVLLVASEAIPPRLSVAVGGKLDVGTDEFPHQRRPIVRRVGERHLEPPAATALGDGPVCSGNILRLAAQNGEAIGGSDEALDAHGDVLQSRLS